MVFALGSVSGAHFNPAVTFAILTSGRGLMKANEAAMYVGAQLFGGLSAGLTCRAIYSTTNVAVPVIGPQAPYGLLAASFGELVFTFVLCFVVLSVATTKNP